MHKETDVMEGKDSYSTPSTTGRVLHSAAGYDFMAWLLLLGRERALRERLVRLARIEPGQTVLDIGCGTGSLAIAAKRQAGPAGTVQGIDASPEMIARARKKASMAGIKVSFSNGVVEALPYPDGTFDAVLSTLMLHHLGRAPRRQCAREMRRVVKSGGRVFAVDFGRSTRRSKGIIGHFHRHGGVDLQDIVRLLTEAEFEIIQSGPVGIRDLNFVLAKPR